MRHRVAHSRDERISDSSLVCTVFVDATDPAHKKNAEWLTAKKSEVRSAKCEVGTSHSGLRTSDFALSPHPSVLSRPNLRDQQLKTHLQRNFRRKAVYDSRRA